MNVLSKVRHSGFFFVFFSFLSRLFMSMFVLWCYLLLCIYKSPQYLYFVVIIASLLSSVIFVDAVIVIVDNIPNVAIVIVFFTTLSIITTFYLDLLIYLFIFMYLILLFYLFIFQMRKTLPGILFG